MSLTLRQRLRDLTLEVLRGGIHDSDAMRRRISEQLQVPNDWRFTNTHAWALVDLQASGKVLKRGYRDYVLAVEAGAAKSGPVPAPSEDHFPAWARKQMTKANQANGPAGPRFTRADLITVWQRCGGKCTVTGQDFCLDPVGAGQVKRIHAPSLDRIVAGAPYTRENCRLVMAAVNIALNEWGLDTYLKLARDAVKHAPA